MKIKSLMVPSPFTIHDSASIQEAIALMKGKAIRHLPVVSAKNRLQGFVTLSGLKEGLIPSMLGDVHLKDLMITDPITVDPDEDIEQAARLIYHHKIGGMPVVKQGRVVGIITETDILRAFIDMMGILTASSRLDVAVPGGAESLNRALDIIESCGGDVLSVGQDPQGTEERIFCFRLRACRTDAMKAALEEKGFKVLEAMD